MFVVTRSGVIFMSEVTFVVLIICTALAELPLWAGFLLGVGLHSAERSLLPWSV